MKDKRKVLNMRSFAAALLICLFLTFLITGFVEAENDSCQSKLDSYLRHLPSRKVEADTGKVAIIDSGAEYSCELKIYDKLPVKFSFDAQYTGIEDTVSTHLPAHLNSLTNTVETTLPFFTFNNAYLRVGVSPSFYGDSWTFISSDFRIPSYLIFIRQPNPEITFLAGFAFYPDFQYQVFPVLGLIYKPNKKLTFNLIPRRPNISYSFNEKITLFGEGGFSRGEFEVDKDGYKNAVLIYRQVRVGAGLKLKLNSYVETSLSLGGAFSRYLKYRDSLGKANIKNGLYTEFRTQVRF